MAYISLEGDGNLSPNLTKKEVRAVSALPEIDAKLPAIFELVRKYAGNMPARVTDAGHIPGSVEGGAGNSAHHRGNAFDIGLSDMQMKTLKSNLSEFMREAYNAGMYGFGVYDDGHIHVDTESQNVKNTWAVPGEGLAYSIRHWADGVPKWLQIVQEGGAITAVKEATGPIIEPEQVADKNARQPNYVAIFLMAAVVLAISLNSKRY